MVINHIEVIRMMEDKLIYFEESIKMMWDYYTRTTNGISVEFINIFLDITHGVKEELKDQVKIANSK